MTRIRTQRPAADVLAEIEATLDAVTTPPPDWTGSGTRAYRDDDPMWQMDPTAAHWNPRVERTGDDPLPRPQATGSTITWDDVVRMWRSPLLDPQPVRYEASNPGDPTRRASLRGFAADRAYWDEAADAWVESIGGWQSPPPVARYEPAEHLTAEQRAAAIRRIVESRPVLPSHPRLFREADSVRMLETHQITDRLPPVVVLAFDLRHFHRWCDEQNLPLGFRSREVIGVTGTPDLDRLRGTMPRAAMVLDGFPAHPQAGAIVGMVVARLEAAEDAIPLWRRDLFNRLSAARIARPYVPDAAHRTEGSPDGR